MVERSAELGRLEQMLEEIDRGPAAVAIEGSPGVGKTTLWREAVARAAARGFCVLTAGPAQPDVSLAFSGLGDLLDRIPQSVLGHLSRPQRRALDAALSVPDAGNAEIAPQVLPRAVLSVLRELVKTGPVVLAIDDEQWFDRPSSRVLAFALRRLRLEPVCVLLARRADSEGELWSELAPDFGAGGQQTVSLGPLGIEALGRVLAARLGDPLRRSALRRIHDTSGGNPLYALALARELALEPDGPLGSVDLPLPGSLTEAIRHQLKQLEPAASDPLLIAAAVGRPTLALLQAALPDFTLSDLASADRAGVIEVRGERVAFVHPLLASTYYSGSRPERRRELHRVLAEILEDEEQCAHHLARGAEAPERETANRIERAAGASARRGAPESAAELLEQAARLTPADAVDLRRERIINAAELHRASGDAIRARGLIESLLPELSPGPVRASALLQLAATRTDDGAAMEALLRQVIDEAGGDDRVRCRAETWLAGYSSNRVKFSDMLGYATSAIESARRSGDSALLASALAAHAVAMYVNGREVDFGALHHAVELEDSGSISTADSPSAALGQILFWSDDCEAARPIFERLLIRGRDRGEVYDTGALTCELAVAEWYAGNRLAAERQRSAAEGLARDQGEHDLDLWFLWVESLFAAGRGELQRARTTAAEAVEMADRIGNPLIAALPTTVLASIELWTGQPQAAHDRLSPVRESFLASGLGFLGSLTLGWWSYDIEALIACGQLEQARRVCDDLEERADARGNPNAQGIAKRCRGLQLAADGEIPRAIEAMDAALEAHARRPLAPEIARTLLERGSLQRRAKRKSAAKASLDQALQIFESIEANLWAARARDESTRIGLRRAAITEGLTPAQTRVAELAVSGASTREIANTLYMSPRSVEAHLTKIYREFGVRSRAQLIAALASKPPDSSGP